MLLFSKDMNKTCINNKQTNTYKIALVGNPNVGKTTIFNYLTSSKEKVGNWPGVTIDKKCKYFKLLENNYIKIIDLPGIYSINSYSKDELVTNNFLVKERPNLIINVIDASNLERNLFLTLELKNLNVPIIIFLNMIDEVNKRGDKIDIKSLYKELNIPIFIVPSLTSLHIFNFYNQKKKMEKINGFYQYLLLLIFNEKKIKKKTSLKKKLSFNEDESYKKIYSILNICYKKNKNNRFKLSNNIDNILIHNIFGLPIFFCIILIIFTVAFGSIGTYFTNKITLFFGDILPKIIENLFVSTNIPYWITSLLVNGIFSGIGSVLSFLPQISIIFLFITIMEDSGYMARIVFLTDKLLRFIGLSGKSFISIIMGFGCSVPAIMIARTINNDSIRKKTILITPLITCGARLPIYILFTNIFFSEYSNFVLLSIYFLSLLIALSSSLLFKLLFKTTKEKKPFIIEMPPYRIPNIIIIVLHIWNNIKEYITKAGTSLLLMSIIIWFLQSFDFSLSMIEDNNISMFGYFGQLLAPFFKPIGFGDWRASLSILTGFSAKEAVVSTLGILYNFNELELSFTPLSAYSFMIFSLLYCPCIATITTIRHELNSIKLMIFSIIYQTSIAYIISFIVYIIGFHIGIR